MDSQFSSVWVSPLAVGSYDLRECEAVALFHVEDRVVAEHERGLLLLLISRIRTLPGITELFVEDNLCAFLALSHGTFQLQRLFKGEPQWGAIGAGPKQKHVDTSVRLARAEVAGEWATVKVQSLPWFFPTELCRP